MSTINQIRANRRNAQKSTGPQTPEGKDRVRFNALVHGLRAESAVIPGEDQNRFDRYLERLSAAWMPQDDMEQSLVEQIATDQWKLARLDHSEARIHDPAVPSGEFALAIHRVYLAQSRLERSVSAPSPIWNATARTASTASRTSALKKRMPIDMACFGATPKAVAPIVCSRRSAALTANGARFPARSSPTFRNLRKLKADR